MKRRNLLAGAPAALIFLRHARATDLPRFDLGVASGQPQADGVVLWTRLGGPRITPEVSVAWEVAEDETFTRIAARGLQPERWYWYRFSALGQRSMAGRTRTAPAAGARTAPLNPRNHVSAFHGGRGAAGRPAGLTGSAARRPVTSTSGPPRCCTRHWPWPGAATGRPRP